MPQLEDSRQERFSYEIVCGCSHAEAARRAGYSEKSARRQAYMLLRKEHIASRVAELRGETASARIMSLLERKAALSDIVRNEQANRPLAAIAAIAELNRMEGSYAPAKMETTSEKVVVQTIEYFGPNSPRPERPNPPQIEAP